MEPCGRSTHEGAESEHREDRRIDAAAARELRQFLEARRKAVDESIRERLASFREERATADHVGGQDEGEVSEADVQEDIELALVQLRRETVERIDAALTRLDHGLYGAVPSVEMTSPLLGCARCHSPFAAWTARRRAKPTPRDSGLKGAGQCCSGKRHFDSGEHTGSLGDDSARA